MLKCICSWDSILDTAGGVHNAPPDPKSVPPYPLLFFKKRCCAARSWFLFVWSCGHRGKSFFEEEWSPWFNYCSLIAGYLADVAALMEARLQMAQKYGYRLPEMVPGTWLEKMFRKRKDPYQIWFGLEPGWTVNLADKCILKPTDTEVSNYFTGQNQDWKKLAFWKA